MATPTRGSNLAGTTMMGLTCWLTRRRLGAYQDGELDPAARVRTAAHLEGCSRCQAELGALGRLRTALAVEAPELPDAVWSAFWPRVRARLTMEPEPRRGWSWDWIWGPIGWPRLAFASGFAALAVAAIVMVGPWQDAPKGPAVPAIAWRSAPPEHVAVQSVETADPDSSVMVFTSADAEVVWVFGLQRTEI